MGRGYELTNPRPADLLAYLQQASRRHTGRDTYTIRIHGEVTPYQLALGPTASNVTLDFTDAYVSSAQTGGADDSTNCLFSVQGTLDTTTLNTTLTADVVPGDSTISVASIGSIGADDWIEVGCTAANGGDGYQESGPLAARAELLQVASATGTTITLKGNARLWHDTTATGQYVKAITPVRRLTILGGEFYGGNVATGFHLRGVQDVRFIGTRFRGFSKAAVHCNRSVRGIRAENIRSLGGNNCVVLGHNAVDLECRGWTYDPDGDYVHASGYVRGGISVYDRCVGVTIQGCKLGRYGVGIHSNGTHDLTIRDCEFNDIDGRQALSRRTEGATPTHFGAGIDMGISDIDESEFGRSVIVDDLNFTDVVHGEESCIFYLHDHFNCSVTNVHMNSRSRKGSLNARVNGFIISDCLGVTRLANVDFQGIGTAIRLENDGTTSLTVVEGMTYNGVSYDGQSQGSDWMLRWSANAGYQATMVFRNLKVSNANNVLWLDTSPDAACKVDWIDCKLDSWECHVGYAELATAVSGYPFTVGQLVEIDSTVTTHIGVKAATARTDVGTRLFRIALSSAEVDSNGVIIAHPQSCGFVRCSSAAVNVGDILIQDPAAPTLCKADNTATTGIIGIARTSKANGSAGQVRIAPSPV